MTGLEKRILALLMAAEIVSGFEGAMVLAGLGAWLRIHGDPVGVGWIVSAYLLVSASSAALCGRLGDIFGRRRILICVIAAAGIGSLVSALAPSLGWIILGRAIQGASGAVIPLCYGLAREHMPATRLPFSIGAIVATAAAASAVGLLLGGILTDHLGPQSIFWASTATAFVVALALQFGLPKSSPSAPQSVDWLGGILFAPGIAALLYVFSNGTRAGWISPTTLLPAGGGLALIAVWYWHERRTKVPLIDVRLLANRNCALGNLIMACAAVGVMQMTQLTSMLLQQPSWTGAGLGTSATFVGLIKFPALATGLISSIATGWVVGRLGGKPPVIFGAGLMVAASLIGAVATDSLVWLFIALCLGNMGVTSVYAAVPNIIISASPSDRTSEATGLMAVVRAMSQAIGAQALAICLAASTLRSAEGVSFPTGSAYMLAFLFMAGASAVAMGLGLCLPGSPSPKSARAWGTSQRRPG